MKHNLLYVAATTLVALLTTASTAVAQTTPMSQMEKLNRGLVVLPASSGGMFVSWRLLGTDDEAATTFDILRNGTTVVSGLGKVTSYVDSRGSGSSRYQVVTRVNGEATDTTAVVKPWSTSFYQLHLQQPDGGTNSDGDYTYSPNDCSVGDVDGDGQLELFVKWDPSNSKDNSQSGYTGNVYIDCYRFDLSAGGEGQDAELLWRVDLGRHIRAGAHYTQFMVYDFDGDGRAEMICKTAPGSKDGTGEYVNQAATDATIKAADNTKSWLVSGGRINGGQEYLTVFEGLTGKAKHTIFYNPNRNQTYGGEAAGTKNWGDVDGKNDTGTYGNRGERYLAAVAYLDGPDGNASFIGSRGYYGYAFIWAVDYKDGLLKQRWLNASTAKTSYKVTTYDADGKGTTKSYTTGSGTAGSGGIGSGTMFGNGNHNLSVADVDGDGRDEIVWGSATCDDDGRVLCATGFGHGDAIHLAKHMPDREGYQVFEVHEDKLKTAWDLHDAATGEIIWAGGPEGQDNGRGMAAQISPTVRGSFFSSASERQQRSAVTGQVVTTNSTSLNFRIYWNGDLQEELLDGTKITRFYGNKSQDVITLNKNNSSSCNSTKSTPNLSGDILGDWREEVILWNSKDSRTLNIYTTNMATDYRVPCLLHDHVYRMGICWQNVAYNQPPHLGYYLPDRTFVEGSTAIDRVLAPTDGAVEVYSITGRYVGASADALPTGVYIIRQGRQARKVVVR